MDIVVHCLSSAGVDWRLYGCHEDDEDDVACNRLGFGSFTASRGGACAELRGAIDNPYPSFFGETKEPGWSAAIVHDD